MPFHTRVHGQRNIPDWVEPNEGTHTVATDPGVTYTVTTDPDVLKRVYVFMKHVGPSVQKV